MTFENLKKKLKADKLPVWILYMVNSRGIPQQVSRFQEEDMTKSLKFLDEQIKILADPTMETCFEIKAQAKKSSNGPHAEFTYEFCIPPAEVKEDPRARLNGYQGGTHGYAGLGMLENSYVTRELEDLRSLKRELEQKKDDMRDLKMELALDRKDLERDKIDWEKERAHKEALIKETNDKLRSEYERMLKIYNSNVAAGKEAIGAFVADGLFPLLNELKNTMAGESLAGKEPSPKTEKEELIDSIAINIADPDADLTMEEIKAIGIQVHKLKKQFLKTREEKITV